MNQKKFQKLSVVALIISLLPLVTFIPVLLHITLTDGVRSAWAGGQYLLYFCRIDNFGYLCQKS